MGVHRKLVISLLAAVVSVSAAELDLLKLVMPEARVVAGANITQIRVSPLGQFLLSRLSPQEEKDLQELVQTTGFDPRWHLEEVVIAAPGGTGNRQGLVLARGTFNPLLLLGAAKAAGAEVAAYQGVEVVSAPGGQGAFALLDRSTAVAGDPESVRGAIDRLGAGAKLDPKLTAKIGELRPTQDAWFVSLVPFSELAARVPNPNASGLLQGDLLQSIDQVSGSVKLGALVEGSGEMVARTPQDAGTLAAALRFLAGLVQLNQRDPRMAQLGPLLETLDIKTDKNAVKLRVSIPETQLEALIQSSARKPRP
jgi:hypothetical protein